MPLTPDQLAHVRQAYFGPLDQYLAWHDGYVADTACLAGLDAPGRTQAAQELLQALREDRADARAIIGLGFLRYEDALPLLHDYLRRGSFQAYALEAIAAIAPAGLDQAMLLERLQPALHWTALLDVVIGTRSFPLAALSSWVRRQLLALLTNPDYLVRYHALATLRQLYGLPAPATSRDDELFDLIRPDGHPARHRQAQRQLLALLPPAEAALLAW